MQKIAASLVQAQRQFGPALKSSANPHFRSKYADLSACVEAVIDGLNNNGIMLMQPTHECSDGVIVETLFLHESGEVMSAGKLHVPAAKADPQGYGSALTYARRYSLMAACGIAPEDDDGNAASRQAQPAAPAAKPYDLKAGLAQVEGAATLEALQAVWKKQGAMAAKDKALHTELKNAVIGRKAELEAALAQAAAEAPEAA